MLTPQTIGKLQKIKEIVEVLDAASSALSIVEMGGEISLAEVKEHLERMDRTTVKLRVAITDAQVFSRETTITGRTPTEPYLKNFTPKTE